MINAEQVHTVWSMQQLLHLIKSWLSEMDKSDQGMTFLAFAVLMPHLQY